MSLRGSLSKCIAAMITRYKAGESGVLAIVAHDKAKYYTLLSFEEWDEYIKKAPSAVTRPVMVLTPGELETLCKSPGMNLFDQVFDRAN